MTSKKGKKSMIGNFLHKNLKRDKWLVFEQVLSEWSYKAKSNVEVNSGVVSKEDFFKFGQQFKEVMCCVEERYELGDLCFGAFLDGKYAHLKWVAFNKSYISEIDSNIRLSPDSVYLYDGYTLPEYRGLGLTTTVLDKTFQFLKEIGIKKTYTLIHHDNFPILKAKAREKARKIGTVTYIKIFNLKTLRLKGETKEDYKNMVQLFSA